MPDRLPAGMPYRVVGVLGRGSSAVVYRAVHTTHGGEVALKVHDGPLPRPRQRHFTTECALQWLLSDHPNIVRLLDASDATAARPWTAMQRYDFSLASATARAPLPAARAMGWALDLLSGLSAVHEAGHLHRDVKPSNVLVRDAVAGLSDFGCATELGEAPTDFAAGTAGYLAPELLSGSMPSPRSDVYSAALTLRRLLRTAPGPAIEDLLERASSADPADRPDDAPALLRAFQQATGTRTAVGRARTGRPAPRSGVEMTEPSSGRRPSPRPGSATRAFLVAGAVAALLLVPALVFVAVRGSAAPRAAVPAPTATSPDGSTADLPYPELARLPASEEGRLRSRDGAETSIEFANARTEVIRIHWLDHDGRREEYEVIHPGDRLEVTTYVGHPWLVTDSAGRGLFIVLPVPEVGLVTVT